jgi:hypothetical protein
VKGQKGKVNIQVPQLLEGSACGALLELDIPVKETKSMRSANHVADSGSAVGYVSSGWSRSSAMTAERKGLAASRC